MKEITVKSSSRIFNQVGHVVTDNLRCPFPYYFEDWRKNAALTVGFSTFLIVFMIAISGGYHFKILLSGSTTFLVLFFHVVLGPRIAPGILDIQNWTVGKYIAFSIWQMVACAIAIPVVLGLFNIHNELTLVQKIVVITPQIVGYGATPLIISTLMLRNHMLKESLKNAIKANDELDKIRQLKNDPEHLKHNLLTIYSETRETLELPVADLLFVEASDNYSTFYWRVGKAFEKKILRINLKSVEGQLDNHFTIRCHRSFIVNLNAIAHVTGNANGYKLTMKDCDLSVPVSRAKGKEVIDRIERLRNVIEMN